MSIKSKLEEGERCLDHAASDTETRASDRPLNGAIIAAHRAIDKAIALANPGETWVDEVKREVWTAWSPDGCSYEKLIDPPCNPNHVSSLERVARQVVARRCASALNDYAGAARLMRDVEVEIFLHIDKYRAIAEGGGE